jgi:tRNA (guanine-N1)-methyltransferase
MKPLPSLISFQDNLLAPPVYTRPEDFRGWKVPDILLSGDHKKIEDWRYEQSLKRTTKEDLICWTNKTVFKKK